MPEPATPLLTSAWFATYWYATIPLWPLLGAVATGLFIALRKKADIAHWPVVIGVGLAALLGVTLFFDTLQRTTMMREAGANHTASQADHASEAPSHAGGTPSHAGGTPALPGRGDPGEHGAAAFVEPGKTVLLFNWISLGDRPSLELGQWIAVNLYFDGLTGIMLLFVTVVSLMVILYAVGYMRDHHGHPERGYERFFAFLGLFVFSMCTLVLAGNFVLLYLGWELVGLCSYLLIGFYYSKPEAAAAAKKAFIVNRIGDLGFALGIFALYWFLATGPDPLARPGENPLDYSTVFKYAGHLATSPSGILGLSQATLVGLLLMCGALGKSAQFPLHVWLPDAMEGPTPVSALIHAATMVTAGIYMVARCTPIFAASAFVLDVILTLGLIGAVLAATIAVTQYDMKRILAYSTISQLAFMFVGLGCGVPDSAVFHVFTHAWFKALLFLTAGSVMHSMGGVIDVRRFSGLRAVLPTTYIQMLIGSLSLAGVPLLAGFWSKDELVHAAFERNPLVGIILLATAGLTAYYTFRMFYLCFHGPLRLPEEAGKHPHDSPPIMTGPLWALAGGAVLAGYLGVTLRPGEGFLGLLAPHGIFHAYLNHSTIGHPHHGHGGTWIMYVSALVALGGIGLAWLRYGTAPAEDPDRRALGPVWSFWHGKYYLDELYDRIFVRPLRRLGDVFFATDRIGVDGAIWLVTAVPRSLAFLLHFLQRGAVQGYALGMVAGVAVLLVLWSWWQTPA